MKSPPYLERQAYRRVLAIHGGAPMAAFVNLAGTCARRWLAQTGRPLPSETLLAGYLAKIWEVVNEAGLPRALAANERGAPGEMTGKRVADLVARVDAGWKMGAHQRDLATLTRQLLKTCLQPEFRGCRESYKETLEGVCRRQDRVQAAERVSGSHCVDCPYWIGLRPNQHLALLTKDWVATDPAELVRHRGVFLPEDFRALRIFLGQHLRWACGERQSS